MFLPLGAKLKKIAIFPGILIALLASIVPLTIMNGFFVATVWNWIAVPAFGAPVLTIPTAIGLTLLVTVLNGSNVLRPQPKDERSPTLIFVTLTVYYAVILAFAYVLKGFI